MKYPSERLREAQRTLKRLKKTGSPEPRRSGLSEFTGMSDDALIARLSTANERESKRITAELARRLIHSWRGKI